MTKTVSAGIYARISSDDKADDPTRARLGVKRQIKDCQELAAARGWRVVDVYEDNDTSATRARVRPEYERMLADVRAGRLTGIIVWDVDRLTRKPRELEDVIEFADRYGLALASFGGEIDLATAQGRLTARIKGAMARHEAEQMSRRIKAKFDERAGDGAPHGKTAYGYRRVNGADVIDAEEAGVVREAARRLLSGESLRSIAADLNRRVVPAPRSDAWNSTTLRQVLVRERNAGLRRHRGQVIGEGTWKPIYDRGTHDRIVALITDPERRTQRGSTRRHLLTGIARCGRDGCTGTVVVNCGRVDKKTGKRQPPAYVCSTCYRVRRKQEAVDAVVEGAIIGRLGQPDILGALMQGDPAEVERARSEVAALEARLNLAADEYADGAITGVQLRRITDRLRTKIDAGRTAMNRYAPAPAVADLAGPFAAERWAAAPLDTKRAVIEMLATVTILPTGTGRSFDPATVAIEWSLA
jgi:DNA invertase Pin-like site-specific DNA recombinase